MPGRPQNSPKGLFIKRQLGVTNSTGNVTNLTANSTGLVLDKQIKLSNAQQLGANSTGFILGSRANKPATRSSAKIAQLTDSTGRNAVMVNTTGTTWKYLNVTSVLPQ